MTKNVHDLIWARAARHSRAERLLEAARQPGSSHLSILRAAARYRLAWEREQNAMCAVSGDTGVAPSKQEA